MIKLFVFILGSLLIAFLGACTTLKNKNISPPCHDEWQGSGTSDGNGNYTSRVLSADTDEYREVVNNFPKYKIFCIHKRTPNISEYVIVYTTGDNADFLGITVRKEGDEFIILDKGIIVGG